MLKKPPTNPRVVGVLNNDISKARPGPSASLKAAMVQPCHPQASTAFLQRG